MKRYICPVCEHELTAKSYCPECRKVIRKPWVYDGFLPNEYRGDQLRHHEGLHPDRACIEPNKSRVCETPQETRHNQQFTNMQSSQTVYKRYEGTVSTAPGSQIWRSTGSDTYRGNTRRESSSGSGKTAKKVGFGCGCGCLIVVIGLITMIIGAISSLEVNLEDWLNEVLDESVSVDWGESWKEADYDEIMSAGVRCSGYWHYSVGGKTVYDELINVAEQDMGLIMTANSEEMDNGIYIVTELEEISYYDLYRYWDWEDGYFGVICDTVTDEVHYITVSGSKPKEVIDLGMAALDQVESGDVSGMRKLLDEAVKSEDLMEGVVYTVGNSSVWIYQNLFDTAYYIEVSPEGE